MGLIVWCILCENEWTMSNVLLMCKASVIVRSASLF